MKIPLRLVYQDLCTVDDSSYNTSTGAPWRGRKDGMGNKLIMSYSKFIRQLAHGIEHKILAYDGNKAQGGCLIYLSEKDHTILVPDELIEWRHEDTIHALRRDIEQGMFSASRMVLRDNGGILVCDRYLEGKARP